MDKFVKVVNKETKKEEWKVLLVCGTTGTKAPEVGDIVSVNRRKIKITGIISVEGEPSKYGTKTLVDFVNF